VTVANDDNPDQPTNHKETHIMTIDPDPHPDFAGPDELAAAIRSDLDVGDINNIDTPTATGPTLADIDARHHNLINAAPVAGRLPDPAPPEYAAWLEADHRLTGARDMAHDAAVEVRVAEAKDRQNALTAARAGGKLPAPTAPAAAAAAVEAVRRYDAQVSLAGEALSMVTPALREAWPGWRRELIATIATTTQRAEAALVTLEARLIDRSAAVQQLLNTDRAYGEAKAGEIVEHLPPPGVHPHEWAQPRSQGISVAELLSQGPSLSANADARRLPDLRAIRAMLAASTLNEQWSPTSDDDGPDDDDTLPAA